MARVRAGRYASSTARPCSPLLPEAGFPMHGFAHHGKYAKRHAQNLAPSRVLWVNSRVVSSACITTDFVNRCRTKDGGFKDLQWQGALMGNGLLFGMARDVSETNRCDALLANVANNVGLGMGIMRDRAKLIGASLQTLRGRGGGTVIKCDWGQESDRPLARHGPSAALRQEPTVKDD